MLCCILHPLLDVHHCHAVFHIASLTLCMHWLPVKFRFDFKIRVLTFKALHNKAPEYLCNLITVYESPCNLRSLAHDNLVLVKPKTRLVSYSDRAFCKAARKLWNRLPRDIRHRKSIYSFKCSLKTHVFKTAFNL